MISSDKGRGRVKKNFTNVYEAVSSAKKVSLCYLVKLTDAPVETRHKTRDAEVPRHHLAAKLDLIAPSKPPQNALPEECGMTQHVVGEVSYDCGAPTTVTVKAIMKEKCGFA